MDSVLFESFRVDEEPCARRLREHWLNCASTDEHLIQISLTAQKTKAQEWLDAVITRDAKSKLLFFQARALTLLGFCNLDPQKTEVRYLLGGRSGYLAEVASAANESLKRNHHAKYWFRKFWTDSDEELSWASMRLMLCCVDRRYYTWSREIVDAKSDMASRRWRIWSSLETVISESIKRNEKPYSASLGDTLFGTKIPKGKVHPWL